MVNPAQPDLMRPNGPFITRRTMVLIGVMLLCAVWAICMFLVRNSHKRPDSILNANDDDAVEALAGKLSHTPAGQRTNLLLRYLTTAGDGMRYAAIDALGDTRGEHVANAVEAAFRDSSAQVRMRAMEDLPRIDRERGQRLLLAGLIDEDQWVREDAVQQMSVMTARKGGPIDKRAVPTLIRALDDPDSIVPTTASVVLTRLTGQPWRILPRTSPAERGVDISKWKSWWASNSSKWPAPRDYREIAVIRPERAEPAPDFSLNDMEGQTITLAGERGKVLLINFWGTWCPPCAAETPALEAISRRYKSRGVDVVGVAIAEHNGERGLRDWCKAHGITYRQTLGTDEVQEAFGHIEEAPVSFLIDTQGRVRYRWDAERDEATFESAVKRLVDEHDEH